MYRGSLNPLTQLPEYSNAQKNITIELQQWFQTWLHTITEPHNLHPDIDTSQVTRNFLRAFKNTVKESFDKKFIYFICSRKRVRFNVKKQPCSTFFRQKIKIYLIIENRTHINITISKNHPILSIINPSRIIVTEENITFYDNDLNTVTMDVHKFLMEFNINLGISNRVEYVGLTVSPDERPTDLNHAGLSRILLGHAHKKELRDYFIYHHVFKVLNETQSSFGINFLIANGWTDEIDIKTEADIIEKSFILYFGSDYQSKTVESDNSSLTNNLKKLLENNNIQKIRFYYELADCSRDYATFYSAKTSAATTHHFCITLQENSLTLENLSYQDKNK